MWHTYYPVELGQPFVIGGKNVLELVWTHIGFHVEQSSEYYGVQSRSHVFEVEVGISKIYVRAKQLEATLLRLWIAECTEATKVSDVVFEQSHVRCIPNWKHIATISEGTLLEIDGANVWNTKWTQPSQMRALVFDPSYGSPHIFNAYQLVGSTGLQLFAAGEFSNGVFGFYMPTDPAITLAALLAH